MWYMVLKQNTVTWQPYILLLVGNFLVLSESSNFVFAINVWSNAYIMSVLHQADTRIRCTDSKQEVIQSY